jgi:hypothetical protein
VPRQADRQIADRLSALVEKRDDQNDEDDDDGRTGALVPTG